MANLLQQAVNTIESSMNASMSEEVSITDGRYTTSGVKATFGRTRKELIGDNGGGSVIVNICDVLISKSAYTLNGGQVEPSANHRIAREDGKKYKPTPMIPNEPVWRWMVDANPTVYRIHVVEVAN